MSILSPRLQLKVSQKQILTPGLVQMVTVLQLNRLELKEMINQEIVDNPVLEESSDESIEEITPEELEPLLESERASDPADQPILEAAMVDGNQSDGVSGEFSLNPNLYTEGGESGEPGEHVEAAAVEAVEPAAVTDPFNEIDFGSFFDDYLDPGYKSPAAESPERPSFESFLTAPLTLTDHLPSQLSVSVLARGVREAAESIIGNLDEDGYLTAPLEEIAVMGQHRIEDVEEALRVVQTLEPAGVGARDLRECLLLQIESHNGRGGVAWQIVSNHLKLMETRQFRELAKV